VLRSQGSGVGVSPGHKLVDALCGSEVDELRQHIGKPSLQIDAVELTCFKQRGDDRPVFSALIVTCEQSKHASAPLRFLIVVNLRQPIILEIFCVHSFVAQKKAKKCMLLVRKRD
jgi:hypothetical protein